jgi:hypothetical protein
MMRTELKRNKNVETESIAFMFEVILLVVLLIAIVKIAEPRTTNEDLAPSVTYTKMYTDVKIASGETLSGIATHYY